MAEKAKQKTLLTLLLKTDADVLLSRRRARQIAHLLGFSVHDQMRISTAVSEIVRNAHIHGTKGKVDFGLVDLRPPYTFEIKIADEGPGIANVKEVLQGNDEHSGLRGAKQLVDDLVVESTMGSGTTVTLKKMLKLRTAPFSGSELDQLVNSLTKIVATTPLDEVHLQNQELLMALDQLNKSQTAMDALNDELKLKNENLVRLYSEVRALNESLEEKVGTRTSELEAARDEAIKANTLKSQFVANISHEIRTPMSGILGLTELLVCETGGETLNTAKHVHNSAKALMTLVDDLLDMSKLESGKIDIEPSFFSVDIMVDDVLSSFYMSAKKKNLTLKQTVGAGLSDSVYGAGDRISQVLQNLVQNAIKFTEAGSIEVIAEELSRDERVSQVKFMVRDTGPGISKEDQEKLFQLFVQVDGSTTRKHGGTGLGLALSKRLVELMNGSIGVESEVGVGSTFWFSVPLQTGGKVPCPTE